MLKGNSVIETSEVVCILCIGEKKRKWNIYIQIYNTNNKAKFIKSELNISNNNISNNIHICIYFYAPPSLFIHPFVLLYLEAIAAKISASYSSSLTNTSYVFVAAAVVYILWPYWTNFSFPLPPHRRPLPLQRQPHCQLHQHRRLPVMLTQMPPDHYHVLHHWPVFWQQQLLLALAVLLEVQLLLPPILAEQLQKLHCHTVQNMSAAVALLELPARKLAITASQHIRKTI